MSSTLIQAGMWIATFVILGVFLQRRRKRKANF